MNYPLVIVSRIETDSEDQLAALTLYPTGAACIKPRPYETLLASYAAHLEPGLALADGASDKGKRRLKLLIRQPGYTEDERRAMGTTYFTMLFGRSPGNDENNKGAADALYQMMCDLVQADASTEEAWAAAATAAIATVRRLAALHFA